MEARWIIVTAVSLLFGLALFAVGAQAWPVWQAVLSARRWVRTTGRIIASGIDEKPVRVRIQTSIRRYRTAIRYYAQVVYEYQAGGVSFRGNRMHLGPPLLSSEAVDAQRIADNYLPGSPVTVYYNPQAPAESTLHPEPGAGGIILFALTAGLLVAAIAVFIWILV